MRECREQSEYAGRAPHAVQRNASVSKCMSWLGISCDIITHHLTWNLRLRQCEFRRVRFCHIKNGLTRDDGCCFMIIQFLVQFIRLSNPIVIAIAYTACIHRAHAAVNNYFVIYLSERMNILYYVQNVVWLRKLQVVSGPHNFEWEKIAQQQQQPWRRHHVAGRGWTSWRRYVGKGDACGISTSLV